MGSSLSQDVISINKRGSLTIDTNYNHAFTNKLHPPSRTILITDNHIANSPKIYILVLGGASETVLSVLDLVQKRVIKITKDTNVTNTLHSLQHKRDVAVLSLFYRYYFGLCSAELKSKLTPRQMRIRESRELSEAHPYILEEKTCRTTHFQNDFFTHTVHNWNNLPKSLLLSAKLSTFNSNLIINLHISQIIWYGNETNGKKDSDRF